MNKSNLRIVSVDNTCENKLMSDRGIIDELLDSASLRTFMILDDSIPTYRLEHLETDSPHIFIILNEYYLGVCQQFRKECMRYRTSTSLKFSSPYIKRIKI